MNMQSVPMPKKVDADEARKALALFAQHGVFEIRIPKAGKFRTVSGYFNSTDSAVDALQKWNGIGIAVYITMNPTSSALLARRSNRLVGYADTTTQDKEIVARRWLLIDCDPVRPSGISSSDDEHRAALTRIKAIRQYLKSEHWPDPVAGDSGNGGHLLYAVDLPNDADSTALVERVLKSLAYRFDDDQVEIDTGVFNASRITKLFGTMTCKGENLPERPHRMSRLLSVPDEIVIVSKALLEAMAEKGPKPPQKPIRVPATGDFFGGIAAIASSRLSLWVPALFGDKAKAYQGGYRVSSRSLGRDLEEDLCLHPNGIMDWGEETGMNPVQVAAKWGNLDKPLDAALWLCEQCGVVPETIGYKNGKTAPLVAAQPSAPEDENKSPRFAVVKVDDFLNESIPVPEPMMGSWLPNRGVTMVYAHPGVGKTLFCLTVAMCIAAGRSAFGWECPAAKKVLYLDGEMPGDYLQSVMQKLKTGLDIPAFGENFYLMPLDKQMVGGMPMLNDVLDQAGVNEVIESHNIDLIIVDNLSTLTWSEHSENDAQSWDSIQTWSLQHRAKGRTVLFVHHAGKGGAQRGTSKREVILDANVKLQRLDTGDDGFKITFDKNRRGSTQGNTIDAVLKTDDETMWFEWQKQENDDDKIVELWDAGMSANDIAGELNLSRAWVYRRLKHFDTMLMLEREYKSKR